jgi:hypothetical protein
MVLNVSGTKILFFERFLIGWSVQWLLRGIRERVPLSCSAGREYFTTKFGFLVEYRSV